MGRGPAAVQRINFSLSENMLFTNNTLHANFTGTTNDGVLLWNAAGTYAGPTGFMTDSNIVGAAADDGSFTSVFEPGVYQVELTIEQVNPDAAADNIFGLSLNQVASLNAAPSLATAGVSHVVPITSLTAQTSSICFTANYRITQTLARAVGGALIRALGTQADGTPPVFLIAAGCAIRITKTSDVAF